MDIGKRDLETNPAASVVSNMIILSPKNSECFIAVEMLLLVLQYFDQEQISHQVTHVANTE